MARLSLGSITLIVNGYHLNNGLPYFQKAVPLDLRSRFGKSLIKHRLLSEEGSVAVQCHRLNERYKALFRAMRNDQDLTPPEVKAAGLAILQAAGLQPNEGLAEVRIPLAGGRVEVLNPATDFLHDYLSDRGYSRSAATDAAFAALKGNSPVLLSEAFSVYLDNHKRGKDKVWIAKQKQHWDKLIRFLGDKPLVDVTRNDAKAYRNHRLDSGVKPSSIRREISTIKAVIAKAILELSLGITNQFSSLEIADNDRASTVRIPYSVTEIRALVEEALTANDEQRRIIVALAFTGARLAEIVGLRVEDVDLTNKAIRIRPHPGRKLKNKQSEREVPLLEPAFRVLKVQVEHVGSGMLFPRYTRDGIVNADSASGALNKWAKRLVPDKTMHCFRHSLRDALRAAMCPEAIAKELGGWSKGGDVSAGYGSGYPLRVKRKWLELAYEPMMIYC
jgi:integrase